jgi:hypothetical protein
MPLSSNPVEGAWANMKNSVGNLGSCSTPPQLAFIKKNRLKRIQYRPVAPRGGPRRVREDTEQLPLDGVGGAGRPLARIGVMSSRMAARP